MASMRSLLTHPAILGLLQTGALASTEMEQRRTEDDKFRQGLAMKTFDYQQANLDRERTTAQEATRDKREFAQQQYSTAVNSDNPAGAETWVGQTPDPLSAKAAMDLAVAEKTRAAAEKKLKEDQTNREQAEQFAYSKLDGKATPGEIDDAITKLRQRIKLFNWNEEDFKGIFDQLNTAKKMTVDTAAANNALIEEAGAARTTGNTAPLLAALRKNAAASEEMKKWAVSMAGSAEGKPSHPLATKVTQIFGWAVSTRNPEAIRQTLSDPQYGELWTKDPGLRKDLIDWIDKPENRTPGGQAAFVAFEGEKAKARGPSSQTNVYTSPSGPPSAPATGGEEAGGDNLISPGFGKVSGGGGDVVPTPAYTPADSASNSDSFKAALASGVFGPAKGGGELLPEKKPLVIGPLSRQAIQETKRLESGRSEQDIIDEMNKDGIDLTQ